MDKPLLIYVFDPLCGWCYAFGYELEKLMKARGSEFESIVICGGLVLGDRVGTFDETYPQIHDSVKSLEKHTGHTFGEAFKNGVLKNTDRFVLDSEIPCRAMTILRDRFPKRQVEIAHALQCAFYLDGKDICNVEVLADLASEMGVNREEFLSDMHEERYKVKTLGDFQTAQRMGINGFPALAIQMENKGFLLARGYRTAEEIEGSLTEIMATQSHG